MNKIYLFLLIFLLFSCEETFQELNTDPNNPVIADVKLVLTAAEDNIFARFSEKEESYDYMSGTFIRAFAGRLSFMDQWDEISNRDSDWDAMYDGLLDAQDVIVRGTEQGHMDHVGVAKILTAVALGYLTDIYGAIPYTQALKGPALTAPEFDSQESIYATIFTLLEGSVVDLDAASVSDLGSEDFIYNGDVNKWKAAAYLLLARYQNHLSVRDPSSSASKTLEYVDKAKEAGLSGSSGDLTYPYEITGRVNPWSGFYSVSPWILASEDFMNLMLSTSDPRVECYWEPAINDGTYKGKDNSSPTTGNLTEEYSRLGAFFSQQSSPMHIATYAEFCFIEAEAALRNGDNDRAATAHNAGIIASIDKVAPWYIKFLSGNELADYQQRIEDFKAIYAMETSASISLEKVMTQKYVAMFPMNVESWVDVRRHNYQYPAYHEIPTDDSGNPVASDFTWRGLYPQNEISKNPNTPPSSLFEKLWWNK